MDANAIREMIPLAAGIATVVFLLIAMGRARNGGWGPPVYLFLAGMCSLVVRGFTQVTVFDGSPILIFLGGVGLVPLLFFVAAKEHEWLAILGGLICCIVIARG